MSSRFASFAKRMSKHVRASLFLYYHYKRETQLDSVSGVSSIVPVSTVLSDAQMYQYEVGGHGVCMNRLSPIKVKMSSFLCNLLRVHLLYWPNVT